ncbi:glycosyltransferase family 2 protein [Aquisalinus flavus]|uniref:Glycosyl transferase family A n=1 Tax=Aquisalinus flavus TaxID=1526572 RepID=A0A8J2V391_9PROT|nr:glycosyltransferase family 2 protein [Aquisalinus flavus]MBD0425820.1 glycosyltransferase family 2 protein [Aquisalinus flavus]UNE48577.1 glycosyltransferase family 2 protein [Aquisalinus flavus]GGD12986.1 glycosyl transferase family A [Aquisalinus flavus]
MKAIDICIPTFRRASLEKTVLSVAAQELDPAVSLRIIIADNDEGGSAEPLAVALSARIETPLIYVHAPARNISIARNACLDEATGDYIAFIDDDETAPPDWLGQLLRVAEHGPFDAVFGPSIARYRPDDPAWIVARDYHSNIPLARDGVVETGHTSNALIRRQAPAFDGLRFDIAKGLTGGEDTDYFFRAHRAGASMGIAAAAMVFEPVEPSRLTWDWLSKRRFRAGQSYGYHARAEGGRMAMIAGSALKTAWCYSVAGLSAWSKEKRNFWVLRGTFHAGVVSTLFKVREEALYADADK